MRTTRVFSLLARVSDPDRLNELQRQRALIQEHLAWLDRQIAAEAGAKPTTVAPPSAAPQPAAAPPTAVGSVVATASRLSASPFAAAERIMAQYRTEPELTKNDVRKGCFIYLALAFLVVILGVVALYFYSKSKH